MVYRRRYHTIRALAFPVVLIGMFQLSSCARVPGAALPAPPGGPYLSTTAGADFEQSVEIAEEEGAYISRFNLGAIRRPLHRPATIYSAADTRGFVVSENDGQTWRVIATPLTRTMDVAVLEDDTIVVSGTDAADQGFVVRSADGGENWQTVFTVPKSEQQQTVQLFGRTEQVSSVVVSLQVDPFAPSRVYAGSNLGTVFVGEQSAAVWRTFQAIEPRQENRAEFAIRTLAVSPHEQGRMLAITQPGRLYRISEGAFEEIIVPEDLDRPQDSAIPAVISRRRAVRNATFVPEFSDALLIATHNSLVATRDGGLTWLELNIPLDQSQSFQTATVAVSPTNPNRIFAAFSNVIYRSEDGGLTWSTATVGGPTFTVFDISINPENTSRMLLMASVRRT